jgi:hypothetical protein
VKNRLPGAPQQLRIRSTVRKTNKQQQIFDIEKRENLLSKKDTALVEGRQNGVDETRCSPDKGQKPAVDLKQQRRRQRIHQSLGVLVVQL